MNLPQMMDDWETLERQLSQVEAAYRTCHKAVVEQLHLDTHEFPTETANHLRDLVDVAVSALQRILHSDQDLGGIVQALRVRVEELYEQVDPTWTIDALTHHIEELQGQLDGMGTRRASLSKLELLITQAKKARQISDDINRLENDAQIAAKRLVDLQTESKELERRLADHTIHDTIRHHEQNLAAQQQILQLAQQVKALRAQLVSRIGG